MEKVLLFVGQRTLVTGKTVGERGHGAALGMKEWLHERKVPATVATVNCFPTNRCVHDWKKPPGKDVIKMMEPSTQSGNVKQRADAFRQQTRPSGTMRWLGITARTGHVGVAAVLFGGTLLLVPFARLTLWHHLTILTGFLLLVLEWLHDSRWLHRGKGLLALLHLGLCLLIHFTPTLTVPLLWLILISGCIGSHMPRRFRHWSILQGWETREPKEQRN
jgi:hypothetical protein